MAIGVAIPKYVSRSSGGNACCKSAYNARSKILDNKTGEVFNWIKRGGNVFHEILLPDHVSKKFSDVSMFSNEVERIEKKCNSQLYVEWLVPLAKEEDGVDLEFRIETAREFVKRKGWVEEGLGVQIDIHKPHEGNVNWHAHILVTTRRFTLDGKGLGEKARDMQPINRRGIIQNRHELNDNILLRDIQNEQFKARGMSNRVDLPGVITQEHIGPIRMRSVLNEAAARNEERRIAEIEHLNNGAAVLDKVTSHISVFSRGDLMRAVKCVPNIETREKLVEDALANKSIIALFKEDGTKIGYFTTAKIRLEESKILRLGGYVANGDNIFMKDIKDKNIQKLVESARGSLTREQHIALSELITSSCGLRILRGRAGVGKSRVLGQIALIARASNINVIGLAPTHKAREALIAGSYSDTDTIKGMLFKLHNARFSLPKHSLLVVDEAGMIGNDDYQELLRVAATRKCNVILSGDERQLSSVGRGGMFEVFAGKYGSSTILDIKRQKSSWGKSVAQAFSEGNVRSGISILTEENRINRQASRISSMEALLADWHKSSELARDRLILAVKNKDVAALNGGVRQYLKAEGKLVGLEIELGGNHYMKGDRILIQKTNKELGIVNGDLAEILEVAKDRFVISMQNIDNLQNTHNVSSGGDVDDFSNRGNTKIIEFNPLEYQGFRHGYATTVFKSQGASIKDVYVFHDGFAGLRNSYVALSRHISELKLYVNSSSTPNQEALIKQLSYDPENGSSLHFYSEEDSKTLRQNSETLANLSLFDSILLKTYDFASRNITKLTDKYLPKSEYYNYQEPEQKAVTVTEVIDRVYEQSQNIVFENEIYEQKLVVGGNIPTSSKEEAVPDAAKLDNGVIKDTNISTTSRSSKSRFYANADFARAKLQRQQERQTFWSRESEELRQATRFKAEQIARDLLGEPNKKLSNGRELKFGDTGKITVRISGEKAGTWYDFAEGKGGDLFDLAEHKLGGDFKTSAEYLRGVVGGVASTNNSHLRLVQTHDNSNITEKYIKEQKAKQIVVNKLLASSKVIEAGAVAHRYFTQIRSITCDLGNDIKTTSIYEKETNRHLPAVVGFARDAGGNITGGVQILLDGKKGNKAGVTTPKKSFGRIAGSFVNVGGLQNSSSTELHSANRHNNITIIAEGLETALSVKQALSNDPSNKDNTFKILCSLGIGNIKNYKALHSEKIIIAADNDGEISITDKTIENAKVELAGYGAFVEIVRPSKGGDFNDILKDKTLGEQKIQSSFDSAITRHSATTLAQYFSKNQDLKRLSRQEQANIAYISQFKINEEKIIDAYRGDAVKGREALEQSIKPITEAHNYVKDNMHTINSANIYGAKIDRHELTLALVGKNLPEMDKYLFGIREIHYFRYSLDELAHNKQKAKTPIEGLKALKAEQDFLAMHYENHAPDIHSKELLDSIKNAHQNQLHGIFNKVEKIALHMGTTRIKSSIISDIIKNSSNSDTALDSLTKKYHGYVIHVVQKNLHKINLGTTIIANNKPFTCKIQLLEHLLSEQQHNEFFPRDHIQNIHNELVNHQKQLSNNFHGLSL
jgi:Ti-type conjugative transfer relaxase TraA